MTEESPRPHRPDHRLKWGLYLVLLFGAINLFSDMTYEGARSVTGPFLATIGASGFIVGSITGFGEFLGYALRFVSGRWPIAAGSIGRSRSAATSFKRPPCPPWRWWEAGLKRRSLSCSSEPAGPSAIRLAT
jgi:hypothetical protein